MNLNAGILLDLGNSNTRMALVVGPIVFRVNLSNQFAALDPGYRVASKYEKKTTVFKHGQSHFANGLLVEREFKGKEIRPSALRSKSQQVATELSLNLAFIKALQILAQLYNVPVSSLQVTFAVGVLMPPLDHEDKAGEMEKLIRKFENVEAVLPYEIKYPIAIDRVIVESEAVAAFFGAFYKQEGLRPFDQNANKSLEAGDVIMHDNGDHVSLAEVPENSVFNSGYTLVLDIGAGTTDVALFLDMELVENSKDTFPYGGNTVESLVGKEIRQKYSFTPTNLKDVITTGVLHEGLTTHDVSDIITDGKQVYSQQMLNELTKYLEGMSINIRNISGLIAAGGGALATVKLVEATEGLDVTVIEPVEEGGLRSYECKGQLYAEGNIMIAEKVVSPAMSEVLVEFLKDLAPKIQPLSTKDKNLRYLNIDGLLYLFLYQ
jgi:hypothetical protein